SNISFREEKYANLVEYKFKARILILIKPTTFMNLSGKAINYWLQKEKINIENLLVLADDIALPFGTLRLRPKGGDAGHNGLHDIIQTLGHQKFSRLRFGIGSDFQMGQQVDHVLGNWSEEEQKLLPERIEQSIKIIQNFVTIGVERTMSQYNNK
ncbi:MAG: aminoacyl-tRNA hydrolase, partial [bacterium]